MIHKFLIQIISFSISFIGTLNNDNNNLIFIHIVLSIQLELLA